MRGDLDLLDRYEEPSTRPRSNTKVRKRTRMVLLGFLAAFVAVATAAAIFVGHLASSFDSKSQTISAAFPQESLRPAKPAAGPAASAVNVLVLGSDSRGDAVSEAVAGQASDQRSDTIMLVHIPADRKNIFIMSVMRDTWLDIPGHGQAKVNAAMAFGGIPLVVQTMEGLFGARIDHVAVVDFDGFKAITDAVGGVPVDVPIAFEGRGQSFAAGPVTMNGDQALVFVRERYAFADGDYQRVRDQQIFLKALMSKLLKPATLANPLVLGSVVDKFAPFVSVDASLDAAAIGSLGLSMKDIRPADVKSFTLPNLGTGTSADGQSIVLPDMAAIDGIAKALKTDQLGSYADVSRLEERR